MDFNLNLARIDEYHKAAARMEKKQQLLAKSRMNHSNIASLPATKIVPHKQPDQQVVKFSLNRELKIEKPVVNEMEKLIFRTHIPSIKGILIEKCCSKFSQIYQKIGERFHEKLVNREQQMKQIKVNPIQAHNSAQLWNSEVPSEIKSKNKLTYDWTFENNEKKMDPINSYSPEDNQFVDHQVQDLQSMFSPLNLIDNYNFQNEIPETDSNQVPLMMSNLQINSFEPFQPQEMEFNPEESIQDYCSSFNFQEQLIEDQQNSDNQFQFKAETLNQRDEFDFKERFDQQDLMHKLSIINKENLPQSPVNVPHNTFQKENSLISSQIRKQTNLSKSSRISAFDEIIPDPVRNCKNIKKNRQQQFQQDDQPIKQQIIQESNHEKSIKQNGQPIKQSRIKETHPDPRPSYQFSATKKQINPEIIQKWKRVKFV